MAIRTWGRIFSACGWLLFAACDVLDPAEPPPALVDLSPFQTTARTAANQADDAWMFTPDGGYMGTFPLPAVVPVLPAEVPFVLVRPGIYVDGQRGARLAYPFYAADTVRIDPSVDTVRYRPTLRYLPDLRGSLPFEDDFEEAADVGLRPSDEHTGTWRRVAHDGPGGGGAWYGAAETPGLDDERIELLSGAPKALPEDGRPVYLEITYRSNVILQVGLLSTQGGESTPLFELSLFRSDDWQKVYVNLETEVFFSRGRLHQVLFRAEVPEGTQGFVHLDDVRLIHR
ncbi:MAG: hypothetical protein WBA12_05425 [Catalinimonas sp.]